MTSRKERIIMAGKCGSFMLRLRIFGNTTWSVCIRLWWGSAHTLWFCCKLSIFFRILHYVVEKYVHFITACGYDFMANLLTNSKNSKDRTEPITYTVMLSVQKYLKRYHFDVNVYNLKNYWNIIRNPYLIVNNKIRRTLRKFYPNWFRSKSVEWS